MKVAVKKEEVKVERKELREAFVLWKNLSKKGDPYLSGNVGKDCGELAGGSVTGFYNTNKKNPKEPDVRLYVKDENDKNVEVAALWDRVTKNEKRILTGLTNEKEELVGFYNNGENEKAPTIKVYFQEK